MLESITAYFTARSMGSGKAGHSSPILPFYNKDFEAVDKYEYYDVIYLHFSEAFDKFLNTDCCLNYKLIKWRIKF